VAILGGWPSVEYHLEEWLGSQTELELRRDLKALGCQYTGHFHYAVEMAKLLPLLGHSAIEALLNDLPAGAMELLKKSQINIYHRIIKTQKKEEALNVIRQWDEEVGPTKAVAAFRADRGFASGGYMEEPTGRLYPYWPYARHQLTVFTKAGPDKLVDRLLEMLSKLSDGPHKPPWEGFVVSRTHATHENSPEEPCMGKGEGGESLDHASPFINKQGYRWEPYKANATWKGIAPVSSYAGPSAVRTGASILRAGPSPLRAAASGGSYIGKGEGQASISYAGPSTTKGDDSGESLEEVERLKPTICPTGFSTAMEDVVEESYEGKGKGKAPVY
jgi:hypothetical protein